jgi:hypothetical protein
MFSPSNETHASFQNTAATCTAAGTAAKLSRASLAIIMETGQTPKLRKHACQHEVLQSTSQHAWPMFDLDSSAWLMEAGAVQHGPATSSAF